jgi:hypothetical protein
VNSFQKLALHLSIDGSSLLKSHAFLSFHMLQHMMMMTSFAKGTPRALLMCQVGTLARHRSKFHPPSFGTLARHPCCRRTGASRSSRTNSTVSTRSLLRTRLVKARPWRTARLSSLRRHSPKKTDHRRNPSSGPS